MPYQEFYLITPEGEKHLAESLKNSPQEVEDAKRRLSELEALLQHDDKRCFVSAQQRDFLRRLLSPYI